MWFGHIPLPLHPGLLGIADATIAFFCLTCFPFDTTSIGIHVYMYAALVLDIGKSFSSDRVCLFAHSGLAAGTHGARVFITAKVWTPGRLSEACSGCPKSPERALIHEILSSDAEPAGAMEAL